jgi:hypothetical protein
MDKHIVHQTVEDKIRSRITDLQFALNDAMEATSDDSKSTAGDKHETSRAMAHLEQEKLGNQYSEAIKLLEVLRRIDPSINTNTIRIGSLVETSMGWFYLSVGLGQIVIDGKTVFCLTPLAPFGQLLLGKKTGDQLEWQGKEVRVLYVH